VETGVIFGSIYNYDTATGKSCCSVPECVFGGYNRWKRRLYFGDCSRQCGRSSIESWVRLPSWPTSASYLHSWCSDQLSLSFPRGIGRSVAISKKGEERRFI